jgi:hypothetical protein
MNQAEALTANCAEVGLGRRRHGGKLGVKQRCGGHGGCGAGAVEMWRRPWRKRRDPAVRRWRRSAGGGFVLWPDGRPAVALVQRG